MKSPRWSRRAVLELGAVSFVGLARPGVLAQPAGAVSGAEDEPSADNGPRGAPVPESVGAGEIWRMGVVELAQAIRRREVSCVDVIDAHLRRIRAVNPAVNAVTVVLEGEARQAAEAADRLLARSTRRGEIGALHGVPMTVKENVDLAGSATTEGVAALRDNLAAEDSPHIAQLRRAGAIAIARTNMPDLGLRWHTDSGLRGATRNPWSAALTPGGSSGGDAVAVATGMTPLGLGNDYGGSLRYPAQCAGVATIRPSRGRVPFFTAGQRHHEWPMTLQLFAVQGPLARSVRDLRVALEHMSGPDVRDPWWSPAPLSGGARSRPVRVALVVDPGDRGVDPPVAAGVRAAAAALRDAGYLVEEVALPAVVEAAEVWKQLVADEIRETVLEQIPDIASDDGVAFLDLLLAAVPRRERNAYIVGLARRNALLRDTAGFLERYPLILGPVSTRLPFAVGRDLQGVDAVREMLDSMRLVLAVSLLGLPAVVVPVGQMGGIPRAVQIIGPMYREDLCLDAAEVIESALGTLAPIDPRSSQRAEPEGVSRTPEGPDDAGSR